MRINILVLVLFLLANHIPSVKGQTIFWQDNFEGTSPNMGGGTRNAPNGFSGTDGSNPSGSQCGYSDYFFRTDCNLGSGTGMTCIGVSKIFAGIQGSFCWRGEDLDGCVADPDMINFTGIDINGRTNLVFLGLFACHGAVDKWEGVGSLDGHPDYLSVLYQIDGGGYTEGIIFRSDASDNANSGDNRGRFRIDTNGDGFGDDGLTMGETFQEYTFDIIGSGSTLDLRFEAYVNSAGEEFAIDDFRVGFNAPTPVELTDFSGTVEEKSVLLSWKTASEINHEKFELERSTQNQQWKKIHTAYGGNNSQSEKEYQYLDKEPAQGIQYYRLRQIDQDGSLTLSKVISINLLSSNQQLRKLYPNPNQSDFVYADYVSSRQEKIDVLIYDITGKLIYSEQREVKKNENLIPVPTKDLTKGLYMFELNNGEEKFHKKLIIK